MAPAGGIGHGGLAKMPERPPLPEGEGGGEGPPRGVKPERWSQRGSGDPTPRGGVQTGDFFTAPEGEGGGEGDRSVRSPGRPPRGPAPPASGPRGPGRRPAPATRRPSRPRR